MIQYLLRASARLDQWLRTTFGKPYGILLTVGLVLEIVHRVPELRERAGALHKLIPIALFALLNLALLIHQLGELSERWRRPEPAADANA